MNLGVFSAFDKNELKELLNHMKLRKAARGCVLFNEKEPAAAIYLVAQGALQITVTKNNKISKLSVIGPGGIAGLLTHAGQNVNIHSATATAREEIVVFEFKYAHIELLQQKNPLLYY